MSDDAALDAVVTEIQESTRQYIADLEKLAAGRLDLENLVLGMARMIIKRCPEATTDMITAVVEAGMAAFAMARREESTVGPQGILNLLMLAGRRIEEVKANARQAG